MGEALGIALATMVNTFNFPLYLLERRRAGGMGSVRAGDAGRSAGADRLLFAPRTRESRRRSWENEAGLFGAAYLPWVETGV